MPQTILETAAMHGAERLKTLDNFFVPGSRIHHCILIFYFFAIFRIARTVSKKVWSERTRPKRFFCICFRRELSSVGDSGPLAGVVECNIQMSLHNQGDSRCCLKSTWWAGYYWNPPTSTTFTSVRAVFSCVWPSVSICSRSKRQAPVPIEVSLSTPRLWSYRWCWIYFSILSSYYRSTARSWCNTIVIWPICATNCTVVLLRGQHF